MIKRLYPYMHKYKKQLFLACFCVVAETVFELIIPVFMADLIDVGISQGNRDVIMEQGLLMLFCALCSLILGILYARYAALAGQGFGAQLRKAQFEKLQDFTFSNIDHFSTASLITRLSSDTAIIQGAVSNGIRPLVRSPVMMLSALIFTFAINLKLACIFLITMPVLGIGLWIIVHKVAPYYRRMQQAVDKVNVVVQENINAIRVVKAYVRDDYEEAKFDKVSKELQAVSVRSFSTSVWNLPLFQAVVYATMVCLLWFGGNMIFEGSMQVGELTGFLSYVLQILNGLMMLSNVFLMLTRSMAGGERILEVLDEPISMTSPQDSELEIIEGSISFRHVSFKYHSEASENVLSDIHLSIPAGSTIGILGGTGSAKSTLVQLIPRLYDVSEGQVLIDHHNVKEYSLSQLRASVAMVLQKNTLFSGTIRENLLWGNPNADDAALKQALRISCADEFVYAFPNGLDTWLEQGGVNLSGGQKQRLCIARALLKQPKILIFDDSTSAVDSATEQSIKAGLAQLKNTTVIIIAQRISSVMSCDQIIILEDGKVNAVGNHDTLSANNQIYQEIYQSQKEGAML